LTSVPLEAAAPPPAQDATTAQAVSSPPKPAVPPPPPETAFDLDPANLQITDGERKFIKRLYPLVPSARATKRFMNIYRLVRVTLQDDERDTFLSDKSYRYPLLLLAILVSHPMEATDILRDLIEGDHPDRWWEFVERYGKNEAGAAKKTDGADSIPQIGPAPDPAKAAEALRWSQLLETLGELRGLAPPLIPAEARCADFARWARRVARYSFESGRVLFTRRNATPAREPAPAADAAQGA
jgi:hypothetical protein